MRPIRRNNPEPRAESSPPIAIGRTHVVDLEELDDTIPELPSLRLPTHRLPTGSDPDLAHARRRHDTDVLDTMLLSYLLDVDE
jgi:hypothetical protein